MDIKVVAVMDTKASQTQVITVVATDSSKVFQIKEQLKEVEAKHRSKAMDLTKEELINLVVARKILAPRASQIKDPQPTSGPGGSNGLGGGFQNGLPGGNQTSLPDNPFQNIGQGYPSGQPSQQPGSMSSSGGPPTLPPLAPAPPLINRPKTGSIVRPESSSTYSVLMPSSPSTHSVDLGHIDEAGEDIGYSPQSKQALLDQTRYHDAISAQHPNPRVLSPKVATIPSTQVHEARAPQLRDSEAVGAILTTGNTSSLNTFDRRHPQSHESDSARDSLFFDPSTNVRGPQDL
ncbi:hypothetical protein BGX34_002757 [Mortierella sp. NVP85]|nr:hypothetical protein BGX34_002757 [Mortierella sp. NVP85]